MKDNWTESSYNFPISPLNQFYITDISSDRTEIRITNNFIPTGSLKIAYEDFKLKNSVDTFFDDFYIDFGNGDIAEAVVMANAQFLANYTQV